MLDESNVGGSSQQGWSEGGPVESLSSEAALAEIKAIENDPRFAGDEEMDFWSRQKMLKRRNELYKRAYPEKTGKPYRGMAETLEKQGMSKESLEREIEKYEERDAKQAEEKLEEKLIKLFGSEQEADKKVRAAQALVKKYVVNPKDIKWIDDSGLGNDLEVVKLLAQLYEIIEGYQRKMPRRTKSSERETTELTKGRWRR